MSQWEADAEVRRCKACGAYVIHALTGGVPVVADSIPLSLDDYRASLIAGRRCYRMLRRASGGVWRLQDNPTAWSSGLELLGAHGCPEGSGTVPLSPPDPPRRARSALKGDARSTSRRSEPKIQWLQRRCARCDEIIGDKPRAGIIRGGMWDWVVHDECVVLCTKGDDGEWKPVTSIQTPSAY